MPIKTSRWQAFEIQLRALWQTSLFWTSCNAPEFIFLPSLCYIDLVTGWLSSLRIESNYLLPSPSSFRFFFYCREWHSKYLRLNFRHKNQAFSLHNCLIFENWKRFLIFILKLKIETNKTEKEYPPIGFCRRKSFRFFFYLETRLFNCLFAPREKLLKKNKDIW